MSRAAVAYGVRPSASNSPASRSAGSTSRPGGRPCPRSPASSTSSARRRQGSLPRRRNRVRAEPASRRARSKRPVSRASWARRQLGLGERRPRPAPPELLGGPAQGGVRLVGQPGLDEHPGPVEERDGRARSAAAQRPPRSSSCRAAGRLPARCSTQPRLCVAIVASVSSSGCAGPGRGTARSRAARRRGRAARGGPSPRLSSILADVEVGRPRRAAARPAAKWPSASSGSGCAGPAAPSVWWIDEGQVVGPDRDRHGRRAASRGARLGALAADLLLIVRQQHQQPDLGPAAPSTVARAPRSDQRCSARTRPAAGSGRSGRRRRARAPRACRGSARTTRRRSARTAVPCSAGLLHAGLGLRAARPAALQQTRRVLLLVGVAAAAGASRSRHCARSPARSGRGEGRAAPGGEAGAEVVRVDGRPDLAADRRARRSAAGRRRRWSGRC